MKDVDPESTDTGQRVSEVRLVAVRKALALVLVHHAEGKLAGLLGRKRREFPQHDEFAVEPNRRRAADLEVQVGATAIGHQLEESIDLSHQCRVISREEWASCQSTAASGAVGRAKENAPRGVSSARGVCCSCETLSFALVRTARSSVVATIHRGDPNVGTGVR